MTRRRGGDEVEGRRAAPATAGLRTLRVAPGAAGARLDRFLADALGASRSEVRALLAAGRVSVDGRAQAMRAKGLALAAGQQVEIAAGAASAREALPVPEPDAPLRVLAEGPGWLAVDKPAGVPVHPLAPDETGTLLGAVLARAPGVAGVGEGGLRSGVVHRLDVDTSGVLLFATEEETWQRLRQAFRSHRVEKRYRAIVAGRLAGEGRLDLRLAVARHRPARVRVVAEDDPVHGARSRPARLGWRALRPLREATLLEVSLETGFLHQIRASFASLGHPVLGDEAYGGTRSALAPRQLLHAAWLRFGAIRAESPDPPDFAAALAALAAGPAEDPAS